MLSIFLFTLSHVSPKEMAKDSSPTRSMMDRRSRAMWLNARSSSSIGRVTVPSYFFSSESKSTAEDSAMSANTGIFLRRRLHLSLSSLLMVSVIVFAVTCSRVCSSRSYCLRKLSNRAKSPLLRAFSIFRLYSSFNISMSMIYLSYTIISISTLLVLYLPILLLGINCHLIQQQ